MTPAGCATRRSRRSTGATSRASFVRGPITPASSTRVPIRRRRATRDARTAFEATPLVVGGMLYFATPSSRADRARRRDGARALGVRSVRRRAIASACRGRTAASRTGRGEARAARREARILFGTTDGRLVALDARTGRAVPTFGDGGAVNLRTGMTDVAGSYTMTSPPAIWRDLVITGALVPETASRGPSGDIRAFDVRTGRSSSGDSTRCRTRARPATRRGSRARGATARARTSGRSCRWTSSAGSSSSRLGSAASDFYGGDRKGANLYANSIVALDAATGKRRWHRQLVHHDIWDYDLASPPALVTIRRDGREIPAVVQMTKSGVDVRARPSHRRAALSDRGACRCRRATCRASRRGPRSRIR